MVKPKKVFGCCPQQVGWNWHDVVHNLSLGTPHYHIKNRMPLTHNKWHFKLKAFNVLLDSKPHCGRTFEAVSRTQTTFQGSTPELLCVTNYYCTCTKKWRIHRTQTTLPCTEGFRCGQNPARPGCRTIKYLVFAAGGSTSGKVIFVCTCLLLGMLIA